jgi:nucleoside-diphosphate-sugar epimerase
MRILVIGGTGFIGARVLHYLIDEGHEVMVFHRGQTETALPPTIQYVYGDRRALPSFAEAFRRFSPQVTLDIIPYSDQDALTLMQALRGITERVVALSSQDVYRAYGLFTRLENGWEGIPETAPPAPYDEGYDEDAPLRTHLYPYRTLALGPDELSYHYEKILVERTVMNEPELRGTILRLPQVYGPGDRQHRLFDYLKRMDDGRRVILLGETQCEWRWTRGYVENVAAAIALAVTDERAARRIYNIGEPEALTEAEWVRAVGKVVGWDGEVVAMPEAMLPAHLAAPYDWRQHLAAKTSRIRAELGYEEKIPRAEALRRTVEWERANPPREIDQKRFDYAAEDLALSRFERVTRT